MVAKTNKKSMGAAFEKAVESEIMGLLRDSSFIEEALEDAVYTAIRDTVSQKKIEAVVKEAIEKKLKDPAFVNELVIKRLTK